MSKKKQVRVEFRKNRAKPPRDNDVTQAFRQDADAASDATSTERVRAKGDLSRRRTVTLPQNDDGLLPGRVLRVHGLHSYVETADGALYRCAVRRLLKTVATDERNAVTTGDRVWFRASSVVSGQWSVVNPSSSGVTDSVPTEKISQAEPLTTDYGPLTNPEGFIERVEPRRGVLTRASRRREHVLVANVDQLVIVISLKAPDLKPHLIDRYLAAAQQGELAPIVCLNKADLADAADYQPMLGHYARLGVPAMLTSARTGLGVSRLKEVLRDRATVFSGQSGVGKSSLLNGVQPGLGLRVREVSDVNSKGRHTTTATELIRLEFGGYVVDTPGVRQMQLWDTRREEMEGFFPEFSPFVHKCDFPDCTHTHEGNCAIKTAVGRRLLSERRYQSYLGLYHGVEEG